MYIQIRMNCNKDTIRNTIISRWHSNAIGLSIFLCRWRRKIEQIKAVLGGTSNCCTLWCEKMQYTIQSNPNSHVKIHSEQSRRQLVNTKEMSLWCAMSRASIWSNIQWTWTCAYGLQSQHTNWFWHIAQLRMHIRPFHGIKNIHTYYVYKLLLILIDNSRYARRDSASTGLCNNSFRVTLVLHLRNRMRFRKLLLFCCDAFGLSKVKRIKQRQYQFPRRKIVRIFVLFLSSWNGLMHVAQCTLCTLFESIVAFFAFFLFIHGSHILDWKIHGKHTFGLEFEIRSSIEKSKFECMEAVLEL